MTKENLIAECQSRLADFERQERDNRSVAVMVEDKWHALELTLLADESAAAAALNKRLLEKLTNG